MEAQVEAVKVEQPLASHMITISCIATTIKTLIRIMGDQLEDMEKDPEKMYALVEVLEEKANQLDEEIETASDAALNSQ